MKTMYRLALAAAVALAGAPAFAATTTSTFQVTATVQRTCQIQNALDLGFGTYDTLAAGALNGSTTFQFRCNKNTPYQIGIDNGLHYGAAAGFATDRSMQGGTVTTDFLAYRLFRDASRTLAWGTTLGTNTLDGTAANNGWTTTTVYGAIPAGQDVTAQAYTDATVTITVNY